jgi:hypothetical protein
VSRTTHPLRRLLAIAFTCFAVTLLWVPVARADEAREEALALFEEGKAHYKKGELEAARASFAASLERYEMARTEANLGQVELELGEYVSAADHLQRAIASMGAFADERPKAIAGLEERLAMARKHIVTVALRCTSKQLPTVYVDGRARGVCSHRSEAMHLEPGQHRLEIRNEAFEPFAMEIAYLAGTHPSLLLELHERRPKPKPKQRRTARVEETEALPWWPGALAGGVGLAGMGVGVGLAVGPDEPHDAALPLLVGGSAVTLGALAYLIAIHVTPAAKPSSIGVAITF